MDRNIFLNNILNAFKKAFSSIKNLFYSIVYNNVENTTQNTFKKENITDEIKNNKIKEENKSESDKKHEKEYNGDITEEFIDAVTDILKGNVFECYAHDQDDKLYGYIEIDDKHFVSTNSYDNIYIHCEDEEGPTKKEKIIFRIISNPDLKNSEEFQRLQKEYEKTGELRWDLIKGFVNRRMQYSHGGPYIFFDQSHGSFEHVMSNSPLMRPINDLNEGKSYQTDFNEKINSFKKNREKLNNDLQYATRILDKYPYVITLLNKPFINNPDLITPLITKYPHLLEVVPEEMKHSFENMLKQKNVFNDRNSYTDNSFNVSKKNRHKSKSFDAMDELNKQQNVKKEINSPSVKEHTAERQITDDPREI